MPNASDRQEEPSSPLRQIDFVADRFEQEYRQGNAPRIAAHLDEVSTELRSRLLVELICIDLEHRRRNHLPVELGDYYREFPELVNLSPADRADLEAHARPPRVELGSTTDYVSPATEPARNVPRSIGRFLIGGWLGSGGQADAFLSVHPEFNVPVVVKWHHAQESPDAAHREHLIDEGRILAGLDAHPNLLRVYEIGFHERRPFLVLEHVQGRTLDNYVTGERPTAKQAAEFVAALAEAVHAAHERDVVHLDINPRNVLIDGRGQPRLIDFGLAWFQPPWTDPTGEAPWVGGTLKFLSPEQALQMLSLAGIAPGYGVGATLEYRSPEQDNPAVGSIDRQRIDVFGLGAVLYFLLTRQPLYDAATVEGALRQAARGAYDAAALEKNRVPKRLKAVCRKALARDPQARFATAAEMATALRAAVRRPRWRGVAVLTGLLLTAVACGWLLGKPHRNGPAAAIESDRPALAVRVWRRKTQYAPLGEALPVRNGDKLQVRFRVPAGLHIGLFSVNGRGQLALLEQYPPRDAPAELVYPASEKTRELGPPPGTELLLVCGSSTGPVSEAEVSDAWGDALPWPSLASRRLLRLQASRVKDESEKLRDFIGAAHDQPESDPVIRRLDGLRERLTPKYPFFEGLAFLHE